MRLRFTIALLAVLALAPAARGATFTSPLKLAGGTGGEPSLITDPLGDAFVAGPQGIPSGANGSGGVGFWSSHDDGSTFGPAKLLGSDLGGGDSDLAYSKGAVYLIDLEAAAAQICKSTDRGATFTGIGPTPDPSGCTTTNGGQAGPSDDRQWLTPAPDGTIYLTYHEFVSAQPVAFRSDNGGADQFATSCGPLVTDPTIQANVPTDITGGTLVSKPVTDANGNFYVLFSTTTQQENALAQAQGQTSGTFSQLYLAVSKDKCQTFTDYTVFDGEKRNGENTVQFGNIFNDLAIDGAGNLYAVGAGYIGKTPFAKTTSLYVLHSGDHGQHWSDPVQVGGADSAHMLPAAAGGPQAGQLSLGYFRTVNGVTDPNNTTGKWTYQTAQSADANSDSPSFELSDVSPGTIYHNGDICNAGTLCGTVPGGPSDRSLLDFTSAALDAQGCPLYTFAGNPTGSPGNNTGSTFNYVTRQTSNCFSTGATAGGGSGGGSGQNGNGGAGATLGGKGGRGCPVPTGRLTPGHIGRLALGETRTHARLTNPRFAQTRNGFDNFCLRHGWGIRVGYPSAALLRTLPTATRSKVRSRIIVALTANRYYALDGIRPTTRASVAIRRLRAQRPAFHVGRNYWYIVRGRAVDGVLKVHSGRVQEIGIVTRSVSRTRAAQRRLFHSLSAL